MTEIEHTSALFLSRETVTEVLPAHSGLCLQPNLAHLSRHEMPEDKGDLAHQNIKNRYYGVNDPVAKKIMTTAGESPAAPPEDHTIKSLFIGNVDQKIKEQDLR